jgi:hypothetical protein
MSDSSVLAKVVSSALLGMGVVMVGAAVYRRRHRVAELDVKEEVVKKER